MANRRRNVRAHTRQKPGGGTTQVGDYRQRRQAAGPGRPLISPRHAWQLFKRAGRAGKRKKRGLALFLAGLGCAELGAWVGLQGASFMLATAGVLCLATAAGGFSITGMFR